MNGKNIILPIAISVIITAIVVGGGMYLWQMSTPDQELSDTSTIGIGETEPEAQPSATAEVSDSTIVEYNCEQSGGTYADGACDCSAVDDPFVGYEQTTGYCVTANGSYGGVLGAQARELLACRMIKRFNCEQSGGVFEEGECNCSVLDDPLSEYEDSTGYCLTADGSPGGELGETERKLLEFEMMENE